MASSTRSSTTLSTGQNLPPPQSPFVDLKTGVLSNDGYKYLLGLINQLAVAVPTASLGPLLEAVGGSQATALALANEWNIVTSSVVGGGVLLSIYDAGQAQVVFNQSGISINVYPPVGFTIDALAENAPYSLSNGKMQIFNFQSTSQIASTQLQIP